MKLNIAIISLITVITSSFAFANTLGLEDNGDGTWNVNYSSDGDIAGFQFNIVSDCDGITFGTASGGTSSDNGFTVSVGAGGIVLGFSFSGSSIPAGEGILISISFEFPSDFTQVCLINPVIASSSGGTIATTLIDNCQPADSNEIIGSSLSRGQIGIITLIPALLALPATISLIKESIPRKRITMWAHVIYLGLVLLIIGHVMSTTIVDRGTYDHSVTMIKGEKI